MTAATVRRPPTPEHGPVGHEPATSGAGALLRFAVRRERSTLPWWLCGAGLLLLVQSAQSQRLYGTAEDLAKLRASLGGNAAVIAMSGPEELLATIGGEVVFEMFSYLGIVVALMSMFLVGRHTRADEEAGRTELIRSARVGRHAALVAALALAALANLTVGVLLFVIGVGTGLPVVGSALLGAAVAALGIVFAAATAVAVQVFEHTRGAYGAVGAVLGAAYMLRAAGDVGDGTLSWLSPFGWGQRTFPYVHDRWWPLALPVVTAALLVPVAVALQNRRDFGVGLLRPRLGRPRASAVLTHPVGLAWRLQRGTLIGWAVGVGVLGAAFGSIGDSLQQYIEDNPEVAEFLPGGAVDIVDSYLSMVILITALTAAAYGVISAMRVRAEETSGRAEPVLATATSRWSWLASHLSVALIGSGLVTVASGFGTGLAYAATVSEPGQILRMTGVSLVYLPAVWSIVGLAVLGIGLLPRAAAALAWTAVGYCAVVAMFADSFDLPGWARRGSPFGHTPQAPLADVTAQPLIVIGLVAVALLVVGAVGLRRRDIG